MPELEFHSRSEAETGEIAGKILETCKNAEIFAIFGDLGAGKTALVKAFCSNLSVKDAVKSPTFSIVNEYHSSNKKIFHFDLYRIKNLPELFEIGFMEYIESGSYCFIEWPEQVEELIPENSVKIYITISDQEERKIKVVFSKPQS